MRIRKRSWSKFFQSRSGLTSTEFALLCAVLAVVAALAVKEIGGAMSKSMYAMADNVGGNDPTPVPPASGGNDDPAPGDGGGPPSDGDNASGGSDNGSASEPADSGKKKKKKKKKRKRQSAP